MLVYGECECLVMQMLYVCVLCASCGSSQCCVLHYFQFVDAGRAFLFCLYIPGNQINFKISKMIIHLETNCHPAVVHLII